MNETIMRSDLSKARGLGSAKHGVEHFISHRVCSFALVPLILWFMYSFTSLSSYTYFEMINWMQQPWNMIGMVLLVTVFIYHNYLSMQLVLEDYVHHPFWKLMSLMILKFVMVIVAIFGVYSLLKIAFGNM